MKKNLFPLCLLFLLCAAALCGCAEDDEPIAATDGTILTIHATADGFTSAEGADTRATESGYTTTFTADDKIGVFAVKDGAVIDGCRNVKCTYNAGNNTWNASAPVYYYKDAQYFAYYPYKDELSSENITSVDDIVNYFNKNVATNQDTYAKYTAWDLMTTGLVSPSGGNKSLSFSFVHKMSLIEISLSAKQNYKTSNENNAYKYSALTPITTDATFSITKGATEPTSITPYNMGRGVYRYILPANTTCTIEGEFSTTDNKTIKYSKTVSPLFPSNYKRLNVTYDGSSSTVTVRALAIGDYYYSDGNIVPEDTPNPPSTGCIGVIYCVNKDFITNKSTKKTNGNYTHALVVALDNWGPYPWGDAIGQAYIYGLSVKAPTSSSGWYLPNIEELKYICWGNNENQSFSGKNTLNTQFSKLNGSASPFNDVDYWSSQSEEWKGYTLYTIMRFAYASVANTSGGSEIMRYVLAF